MAYRGFRGKRKFDPVPDDNSNPVLPAFKNYQNLLDQKHDKYERLVKKSRDVTIESKRIIFLLHRINSQEKKADVLTDAERRITELEESSLHDIALELKNEPDWYQFHRAFSPGFQEYVEAVTFYFYVKEERLVTLLEIQDRLIYVTEEEASRSVTLSLPPLDYMLGLADLTGELMRKCINSVGEGDLEEPFKLGTFLSTVYNGFVSLGNTSSRELSRKVQVLRQSLQKVESACYTIKVRGSELPQHMLVDVFSTGRDAFEDNNFEEGRS